jgi:hypothetical protein
VVAAIALLTHEGFARPRADYVLQLVTELALALVALAFFAVLPAAYWVHRAFKRGAAEQAGSADIFEAQRGFANLLRMPSFRWFPVVNVRWEWIEPPGFRLELLPDDGALLERVEATERAHAERVVRRFVVEDAFGLARIVFDRTEARTVRALPWTGRLNVAPMLRSHVGGDDFPHPLGELDGDRVDMRPYVPGDPLRLALWKVYARTRELMVRTPERAISPSLRIIAYLPSAEQDDPPAAAARVAIEHGLLGEDWTFSADGALHAATTVDEALTLITRSRAIRGEPEASAAGLPRFLEEAGDVRNRLILFVPAQPGPWLQAAIDALRGRQGPVTAVIATDGVRDSTPLEPRYERWLKLPAPPPSAAVSTPSALMEVARTFAAAGANVVGLERPSGRALNLGIRPARDHGGRRVA